MPRVILQPDQFQRLLRRRRLMGGDRYDEVWNGVYVMSPLADNEHQEVGTLLTAAILPALSDIEGVRVFAGTNVTDQPDDWRQNYRCPDVAVFLPGNPAEDRGSHWYGGPDFAVEVLSPGDRSRKKFDFYAAVGVRELLLIDRKPWRLELYRRNNGGWLPAETSAPDEPATLASAVLPLNFRLRPDQPRPRIEVPQTEDARTWTI